MLPKIFPGPTSEILLKFKNYCGHCGSKPTLLHFFVSEYRFPRLFLMHCNVQNVIQMMKTILEFLTKSWIWFSVKLRWLKLLADMFMQPLLISRWNATCWSRWSLRTIIISLSNFQSGMIPVINVAMITLLNPPLSEISDSSVSPKKTEKAKDTLDIRGDINHSLDISSNGFTHTLNKRKRTHTLNKRKSLADPRGNMF